MLGTSEEGTMPRSPKKDDEVEGRPEGVESNVQGHETEMSPVQAEQRDAIARRAYDRYQARGGEHGHDQDDWFEAERELNQNERR
jgi:hypothetical protein